MPECEKVRVPFVVVVVVAVLNSKVVAFVMLTIVELSDIPVPLTTIPTLRAAVLSMVTVVFLL